MADLCQRTVRSFSCLAHQMLTNQPSILAGAQVHRDVTALPSVHSQDLVSRVGIWAQTITPKPSLCPLKMGVALGGGQLLFSVDLGVLEDPQWGRKALPPSQPVSQGCLTSSPQLWSPTLFANISNLWGICINSWGHKLPSRKICSSG